MAEANGPLGLLKAALRRTARSTFNKLRRDALPGGPPSLRFLDGPAGPVAPGATILAGATALGVDLDHYCGGTCSCGTCRVEIVEGADALSPATPREAMVLGDQRSRAGDRLACQAQVRGPVTLRVPRFA